MNFKIGDTLDYESVIGLGICSGKVVGVSNVGEGEAQPLYATVRNQMGHDITVHWTRVVKVHPCDNAHESRTLGVQTEGSHSDLQSEVERLYIGWSKEIALAAEAKIEYEKVLMEKDAEIERLLTKAEKDKNTLLISLEAATKEVQRLKAENEITVSVCNENTDLKKLITELGDALITAEEHDIDYSGLIRRAREATR